MTSPDTIGAGVPGEDTPVSELSYEQARDELIEVVRILELGNMMLDESLAYWERGEALAQHCEKCLAAASTKVEEALAQSRGDESAED